MRVACLGTMNITEKGECVFLNNGNN